jgi:hypothetical protein
MNENKWPSGDQGRQLAALAHLSRRWDERRKGQRNIGPYLLVSRETGAGGSQIARHVAQELAWDILDKEILDILASEFQVSAAALDVVDEKKLNWLADILTGWVEGHGFSQLAFVHRMSLLFNKVAERGNVVIVGRGARFILPRLEGLSVRIIAPFDFRVEQVILQHGLSATDARTFVKQSDRQREAYIKRYFHRNVADSHAHDLILNVEQLGEYGVAHLIIDAVQSWLTRREKRLVSAGSSPAKLEQQLDN